MLKNPYIIMTEKRAKELVRKGEATFGLEKMVLNFKDQTLFKVGKEYKTKFYLSTSKISKADKLFEYNP